MKKIIICTILLAVLHQNCMSVLTGNRFSRKMIKGDILMADNSIQVDEENGFNDGEVTVSITPPSDSSSGSTIEMVGTNATKTFDTSTINIYPSPYGRGFYIKRCNDTLGDLEFDFIGYDGGNVLEYEDKWVVNDTTGCEVNRMRGVQYLVVSLKTQRGEEPEGGFIIIGEEDWIMTPEFKYYFLLIMILVIISQVFAMWRANWFSQKYDDDLDQGEGGEKTEAEKDDDNFKRVTGMDRSTMEKKTCWDIVKEINVLGFINVFAHIIDMVSDILYVIKVPKYNSFYDIGLIIFMILPFLATALLVYYIAIPGCYSKMTMVIMIMLNVVGQLDVSKGKEGKGGRDAADKFLILPKIIFLVCEDAPQFFLQLENSLHVGNTWSWLQVTSPLITTYFLIGRFIQDQGVDGLGMRMAILSLIYCGGMYVYIIFTVFTWTDNRPDWAKVLPPVRMGNKWW